ncbi:MAG: ribosome silencing factor [Acidobacteriota bacterium]
MEKINTDKFNSELKRWKLPPIVKKAVSIISDKKGGDIVILKLKGITDLTDFMVICSGNSQKQNKAIADDLQRLLKKDFRSAPLGVEGSQYGDWVLMDYVDFVVHIFSPETREKFSLEKLWMDAKRYDFTFTE